MAGRKIQGMVTDGMKTKKGLGLWQRKNWWVLPLLVLVILVGLVYVLGHMGAADAEMYPTTGLPVVSLMRVC